MPARYYYQCHCYSPSSRGTRIKDSPCPRKHTAYKTDRGHPHLSVLQIQNRAYQGLGLEQNLNSCPSSRCIPEAFPCSWSWMPALGSPWDELRGSHPGVRGRSDLINTGRALLFNCDGKQLHDRQQPLLLPRSLESLITRG